MKDGEETRAQQWWGAATPSMSEKAIILGTQ